MFLLKHISAEKEGFEPPEVLPSTVFKTAAIDHSAISPVVLEAFDLPINIGLPFLLSGCKYKKLF